MVPEKPGTGRVIANVQALRALAVALVVGLHLQLPNNGVDFEARPILHAFGLFGKSGVDLFFAISGFIMLVTNWDAFAEPRAGLRFILHRIVRIYPSYWLCLVPITAAFEFGRGRFMSGHRSENTDVLASFLLYPDPVKKTLFPLSWTLTFEMTFYVIFSLLLLTNRRRIGWWLALWATLQLALHLAFATASNPYLRYVSNLQPLEFISGIVVGLCYVHGRLPHPGRVLAVAFGLAIAIVFATTQGETTDFGLDRVVLFGLPSALVLYAAVAYEKKGFKAPALLVALGDTSYAVYLWHFSIIGVMRHLVIRLHPTGRVAEIAILIATVILVEAVAAIVYLLFERPVTNALNALVRRFIVADAGPAASRKPLSAAR